MDCSEPQWFGKSIELTDTQIFHIVRAFHTTGRCVDCGACMRACPMDVDLRFLNKKIEKDVLELFSFEAGEDPDQPPLRLPRTNRMIPRSSSSKEMEEKTIRKDNLIRLLADLAVSCQVFAPVRKGDSVVLEEILSVGDIHLSKGNTKKSIKEIFFPQRETLFAYRGQETREPSFPDREKVILGVRPCDARSLSLLDPVFDGDDFKDPYYCSKRGNATVIAIGCNHPMGTCFCTATGGDPFSLEGSDVLLIDMGEAYFVRPVTQRGEAFLEGKAGFEEAEQDQRKQRRDEIIEKARETIGSDLNIER